MGVPEGQCQSLDGKLERNLRDDIEAVEIPHHKVTILISGEDPVFRCEESGDSVTHNAGGEETTIESKDVERVFAGSVSGEDHMALVGEGEVLHGVHPRVMAGTEGSHVLSIFDCVDIDSSILATAHRHVKIDGEGDAGDWFVMAVQHLDALRIDAPVNFIGREFPNDDSGVPASRDGVETAGVDTYAGYHIGVTHR